MSPGYRLGWRWLPIGAAGGGVTGAVVGGLTTVTVVMADSATEYGPADLVASIVVTSGLGAFVGALVGGVVGLVVAIPLVVLVGRHLPVRMARRRAFVLGVLLPPLAVAGLLAAISGEPAMLAEAFRQPLDNTFLLAPSVVGGPFAAWAAGRDVRLPTPDVS